MEKIFKKKRTHLNCLSLLLFLVQTNLVHVSEAQPLADDNPYRHFETLDPKGKYQLEWLVNWESKRIIFNVTVTTNGYVGFGLSKKGNMDGADIVIGGVGTDGKPYFTDRHGVGNRLPEIDESQDWTLHNAWARNGQTFLSFSRSIDTCDPDHDLPITDDVINVIWAYGDDEVKDVLDYHGQNRGAFPVYLLDPDLAPRNIQKFKNGKRPAKIKIFNITRTVQTRSGQDSLYWCTFHKVITTQKEHIIGFNTQFPTERDRSHIHHFILHRCKPPPGTNSVEMFEGAARSGGSECYINSGANRLPVSYCGERIFVWSVGGRPLFFPEHVGVPMLLTPDEYFMLQIHYDTPSNISTSVTSSLEIFHTPKLRKHDASMLQIGGSQPAPVSLLIPPNEASHIIYGHCSPGCTRRMIPEEGINLFAMILHTHISGRGIRALHFRNNTELNFILHDDNYDFNYQQVRTLREERKVLPGDQLVLRCDYESTDRNGSIVHGGYSTREEMCNSFMYYYTRMPGFALRNSQIKKREYWEYLGIGNYTWDQSIRQMVLTSPPEYAGLTFRDYANNYINWDQKTKKTLSSIYKLIFHKSQSAPDSFMKILRNNFGSN